MGECDCGYSTYKVMWVGVVVQPQPQKPILDPAHTGILHPITPTTALGERVVKWMTNTAPVQLPLC